MISISFQDWRIDGPRPTEKFEIMLRIVAVFFVSRDTNLVYREEEFPIVELATELHRWLKTADDSPFNYESQESDIKNFLWFAPRPMGWAIGAADKVIAEGLSLREIREAAKDFLNQVLTDIPEKLGIEVKEVIESD